MMSLISPTMTIKRNLEPSKTNNEINQTVTGEPQEIGSISSSLTIHLKELDRGWRISGGDSHIKKPGVLVVYLRGVTPQKVHSGSFCGTF